MQEEINTLIANVIEQVQEKRNQSSGKLIQIYELPPELSKHGDEVSEQFFAKLEEIYPGKVTIECSKLINGSFRLQWSIA